MIKIVWRNKEIKHVKFEDEERTFIKRILKEEVENTMGRLFQFYDDIHNPNIINPRYISLSQDQMLTSFVNGFNTILKKIHDTNSSSFKSYIESEEFVDKLVDRIKRKQL